ncbi:uncharacterized protein KY384_002774 [Bacidia gigantensis]|uniref:uncharacterized protein n=1 Tax=Bacidia gigantensis TaxID=2732470 RepID=UPI001D0501DF|nr:uncharacterized protein KY384_002774 [Bacidia gigantensis]KAG8532896.1 hypothetical protein KY384_002774 [Bacidia gigantensis]
MQSSPTCIRYATSTLLYSCQAIEASNQDAENDLEDLKSVYATQLAICELSDAGSSVPQSCKGLAVTPGMKSTEHLKWIRKSKISECLKALESRPQSWTSYSNSKQNAVTLCRATRIDIEKDDTIKLHQEMVKTQSNANQALQEAAQVVQQGLQKLQSDFDSAREAFNNQLLREIKESTAQTQTLIATMTTSFSSALDSSLRKVRSYSGTLESHLAALTKNIKSASSSTTNLEHNVGKVFQKVVEGSSELAHVQTKQWETSRRVATELQASLKGMQQGDLASLIRSLNDMGVRLDASNELISRIYERQNNFEQRMDNLGHSFSRLESKAEAIGVAQQRQGETQEKLSQQMEVDMQVAQGFLTDVASSAMHLQATVSETSSKIQSMAAFAKVFSTILNWTYFFGCVVLLSIIVTAVAIGWQYNSRLTFYLLILLGEMKHITFNCLSDML